MIVLSCHFETSLSQGLQSPETRTLGSQTGRKLFLTTKSPRAKLQGVDLWGSVSPHSGSPQSSWHLTLPPRRTWILALRNWEAPPLIPGPQSLGRPGCEEAGRMPVVLILPPRLPWTDNRDGLLRSPLIRDLGSSSLLLQGPQGLQPRQTWELAPPEAPPICEVPSQRPDVRKCDHAFWAHRIPGLPRTNRSYRLF